MNCRWLLAVVADLHVRSDLLKNRPSARMLIIDPGDRILLFRADDFPLDPESRVARYWYVPGGAVEQGESFEDAARRELWEETSIRDVEIGPCVWLREQVLEFPGIGLALARERFFPVWVEHNNLSFDNMVDIEATVMTAHRWWSLDDLRQTNEVVFPENLAHHLGPILQRELPVEPITIR